MNILTQEAKKRQAVVKLAIKKGKNYANRKQGVSISSAKRWCKRYDRTWQSLKERSHRPHSHPKQNTKAEEQIILESYQKKFLRYGWDGVYDEAVKNKYTRSFSGMVYAAERMELGGKNTKKKTRKHDCRYPEMSVSGEKVQIDVKELPYCCLRGALKRDGKHIYQLTAIDECTRIRFVYSFEEHTPENTVKLFELLKEAFPFKIQTIQTGNGAELTYKYIYEETECTFDKVFKYAEIEHKLIPPRTPWHYGKAERSHLNDQRYFYDWEHFSSLGELNRKLAEHLIRSNNKTMRTLGRKSPVHFLAEKMSAGAES